MLIRAAKLDAAYSRDYTYADSSDSEKTRTVHDETGLFEDEVFSALKRNKGKWIDCTDHRDFALEVLAVDDSNREFLSALDLVFAEAERDDSVFEQSGDLYTLSSEKLKELFGVPSDAEDGSEGENALSVQFDGNVTANLSAATSPRLTAVSNIGTTSSVGGNVSEVTGSSNREFLFENIDNTVIHVDVGLQPLLLTDLIEDKRRKKGNDQRKGGKAGSVRRRGSGCVLSAHHRLARRGRHLCLFGLDPARRHDGLRQGAQHCHDDRILGRCHEYRQDGSLSFGFAGHFGDSPIICAVLMLIKGLVDAFRSLSAVFSRKSSYGDCVKQTHLLSRGCGKTCATLIGLHVFSVVLADGAPTELYYIVPAAGRRLFDAGGGAVRHAEAAGPRRFGRKSAGSVDLCRPAAGIFARLRYCMLVYLVQPVGYRVVMDLHVLFGGVFNGVYGFFNIVTAMLGPDVLCLVACFMFLSVCKYLLTGFFDTDLVVTGEGSMRQWSMRIFAVMLIGAVLLCFTTLFDAEFRFHFDVAMFSLWWELLLPCYIPVLLASCMGAIASAQGGTAL